MFYAGLDLGQRRDHSAMAVVERRELRHRYPAPVEQVVLVRHIERMPLGTPYPRVVARVKEMVQHPELRGQCALVVDSTGVGAPVMEMLRAARLGCEVTGVLITGGAREQSSYSAGGSIWNVPKRDLLAGVQVLLERGELRIARELRDGGSLARELLAVRTSHGRAGHVRLGADGYGQHDDLVIALALACWRARRAQSGFKTQRLTGI